MNSDRVLPDKLSEPKNNSDILFNFIIDYFKEINISWPKTLKLSTTQHFAKTLQSMLWHVTCHHEYFAETSATIPAHFAKFKNLNDYAAQKHSKPLLCSPELKKFTEKMSVFLTQGFWNHYSLNFGKIYQFWLNHLIRCTSRWYQIMKFYQKTTLSCPLFHLLMLIQMFVDWKIW